MKTIHTAALVVALLSASTAVFAQESPAPPAMPPMPEPTKEHAWLQQFVGEWESEAEVTMEPGQPPMKCKGTETVRRLGGFWVVAEGNGQMPGMPEAISTLFTIGYDATQQKYVGTWVDSMTATLWNYTGSLDPTGSKLVLEAEGPSPMKPGTTARFRDVTEFKSKDHRVLTSSMQGEDGAWITVVTAHYRRKS